MASQHEQGAPRPVAQLEDIEAGGGPYVAYAALRETREGRTRNNDPFIDVTLGDLSANVAGKIWGDHREAQAAARDLPRGAPVKVMFHAELYQDTLQLRVIKLREARDDDEG